MIGFLPISILAYALNGGSIIVNKILLNDSLPKPLLYTFYSNVFQLLVLFLIPFGFTLSFDSAFYMAAISGIVSVFALHTFYISLKQNEASVAGPLVGAFNPLFTIILGAIFLNQFLTATQFLAVLVLIIGTIIVSLSLLLSKVKIDKRFFMIILSGLLFAISYILLREAFLKTSFINGLIISRAAAGLFVLTFFALPSLRSDIFNPKKSSSKPLSKPTLILLGSGHAMGALSGLLITFGTSLANPALVNSMFGIQYVTILLVAIFLSQKHPQLLDEKLTKASIFQKAAGVAVLSFGLYLMTV